MGLRRVVVARRFVATSLHRRATPRGSAERPFADRTSALRESDCPVLPGYCGRGGQRERAALGVPAHGPLIAGMDDRASEFADEVERSGQVSDGEVRKGSGIAGTGST